MKYKHYILTVLAAAAVCTQACEKWTEMKSLDFNISHPKDQNPELWAKYSASLRDYKARPHFVFYAEFENSPAVAVSEKNSLRSLPDSLDIVSLTNADNFSEFDAEDMEYMKEIGTKVLYRIDYAGRESEFPTASALGACLDKAIATVQAEGLDGWAFTGTPRSGDPVTEEMSALIISRLSDARGPDMLITFEGDPSFVRDADKDKIDFYVLDTGDMESETDISLEVVKASVQNGIPKEKIIITASASGTVSDKDKNEDAAIPQLTGYVVSLGPLGGMAITDIGADYYHYEGNYITVRKAIQTLNPSK